MRKKFFIALWTVFILFLLAGVLIFKAIADGKIGYMPPLENLQNPINRFATQIISNDGKVLGTWNYNKENRICVDFKDLSPHIVNALVATEDIRFYNHSGIDFYALARAMIKRGVFQQKNAGGGSTITQQLAKQLYSEKAKTTGERMLQKPIEWVIAVQLERNYTKEEIISLYLNYFDFLHNAVGIKTAANTYFNKEPIDLTINEAALLVGLCKNPSYYNPVRYSSRSIERRNVVLSQMCKAGYITKAERDSCKKEPINLNFHPNDHKQGVATYLREHLRKYLTATKPVLKDYPSWAYVTYFNDSINWENDPLYGWCNKNKKKNGEAYNIYTDGLKVYTTIDSRMQQYAEEAVYEHVVKYLQPVFDKENAGKPNAPYQNLTSSQISSILNRSIRQSDRYRAMRKAGFSEEQIRQAFNTPVDMTVFSYHGNVDTIMTPLDSIRYYKSFLRCGFLSMDARTGAVKAYVGGLDYARFSYDMCMDGRRQVGSTIKPFLYSLAMENGYSPCDKAPNVQQTYIVAGKPWTPRNASNKRYGEMVTLKWGLSQSNNWISAYLMDKLQPEAFVTLLHEYGIKNPEIHPSMSLCLGSCDVSVAEMVSAYTVFANKGIRCAPMTVTRIEDNEGNIIAQFAPRMNEVISESSAYKMIDMLQGVVDQGTAGRLRWRYNIKAVMGGKTGTTNNNSDAWFMGVTPKLVSGMWVGGDDRDIHFKTMQMGQGATMALPIYAHYIRKVYDDETLEYNEDDTFDMPDGFNPCALGGQDDDDFQGIEDIFE